MDIEDVSDSEGADGVLGSMAYGAAASGASGPTTTKFNGLASFVNAGLLTAHNGVVGDEIVVRGINRP